jgi:PTS system mannose-specific IIC component
MHALLLTAIAAVVAGAAAVERKGALQLMLSRPLVVAPLLGAILGDARGGLLLGIPLELLFLGGVNLGGNLPDNETLLAAALTAMVVPAGVAIGGVDPALAALGVALLFPLALFGRRLERASEERNLRIAAEVLRRVEAGDTSALALNLRGLVLPFAATTGICAAAGLASPLLAWVRLRSSPQLEVALIGAWHALSAVAAGCAIRAIRDPRAPIFATLSAAVMAVAALALRAGL